MADRALKRTYGKPPRRTGTGVLPGADDVQVVCQDGGSVRGWFLQGATEGAGPAAVVVHGWGGNAHDMAPVAEEFAALGIHVLLIDARGHGRSDDIAVASMPSFARDVGLALRWLRERPDVDGDRIVLVGHSVGAGACLFAASQQRCAAVVALAPMADPVGFMTNQMQGRLPAPLIRLALRYIEHAIGHRFEQFTPLATIARAEVPVLIIHGSQDATVPVEQARRLHAAGPRSRLIVIDGADHFSVEALDQVRPDVKEFLKGAGIQT